MATTNPYIHLGSHVPNHEPDLLLSPQFATNSSSLETSNSVSLRYPDPQMREQVQASTSPFMPVSARWMEPRSTSPSPNSVTRQHSRQQHVPYRRQQDYHRHGRQQPPPQTQHPHHYVLPDREQSSPQLHQPGVGQRWTLDHSNQRPSTGDAGYSAPNDTAASSSTSVDVSVGFDMYLEEGSEYVFDDGADADGELERGEAGRRLGERDHDGASRPGKKRRQSKMHKCEICRKEFPRPSALATHMNSHNNERPFPCAFRGCNRSFSVRSNARRHLHTHGILPSSETQKGQRYVVGFSTPMILDQSVGVGGGDAGPSVGPMLSEMQEQGDHGERDDLEGLDDEMDLGQSLAQGQPGSHRTAFKVRWLPPSVTARRRAISMRRIGDDVAAPVGSRRSVGLFEGDKEYDPLPSHVGRGLNIEMDEHNLDEHPSR